MDFPQVVGNWFLKTTYKIFRTDMDCKKEDNIKYKKEDNIKNVPSMNKPSNKPTNQTQAEPPVGKV